MLFNFIGTTYKNIYFLYRKTTTYVYNYFINIINYYKISGFLWYGNICMIYHNKINSYTKIIDNYPLIKSSCSRIFNFFFTNHEPSELYWLRYTSQIMIIHTYSGEQTYTNEDEDEDDDSMLSYLINSIETDMIYAWTSKRKNISKPLRPYKIISEECSIEYLVKYHKMNNILLPTNVELVNIFNQYYETLTPSGYNQLDINNVLVTMKINDNYIHRIINNNPRYVHNIKSVNLNQQIKNNQYISDAISNDYNYRMNDIELITFKHFVYISYTSSLCISNNSISINVKFDNVVGNHILSSSYIYNYLNNNSYTHLFSEDYVLNIMDVNLNKFTLKSNEYITVYKDHYIIKEIDIKMI